MTELSTVEPKTMLRVGWPIISSSKVGRSGMLLVAYEPEDSRLRWLESDFEGRRDEECFDREDLELSSPSRCRRLSPRPFSRP